MIDPAVTKFFTPQKILVARFEHVIESMAPYRQLCPIDVVFDQHTLFNWKSLHIGRFADIYCQEFTSNSRSQCNCVWDLGHGACTRIAYTVIHILFVRKYFMLEICVTKFLFI